MRRVYVFLILMAIWVILSGNIDASHLTMGVISCLFVTWISGDLLYLDRSKTSLVRIKHTSGIILYIPWLIWEIVKANLHVLKLAVMPGAMKDVQPRIVRYKTYLKSHSSRFIFANSITLTPGTVTLKMIDDVLYVHAISKDAADSIGGDMEKKIGKIYGETPAEA